MDLSTILEITIMSQLADTIPTISEQHLNESVRRYVKSHADMFLALLFKS